MGHQLAGGNRSWCPELESQTTHPEELDLSVRHERLACVVPPVLDQDLADRKVDDSNSGWSSVMLLKTVAPPGLEQDLVVPHRRDLQEAPHGNEAY